MSILDTARAVLASVPASATDNAFGSFGELKDALTMAERWGVEHERKVVSALARVARQRGITTGDEPFVWDEKEQTHHIDQDALAAMCDALV